MGGAGEILGWMGHVIEWLVQVLPEIPVLDPVICMRLFAQDVVKFKLEQLMDRNSNKELHLYTVFLSSMIGKKMSTFVQAPRSCIPRAAGL